MRPVGSTSGRPRVGAPEGPGSRKRPSRAVSTPRSSAAAHASSAGRIRSFASERTARGGGPRLRARAATADEGARKGLEAFDGIAGGPPRRRRRAVHRIRERGGPLPGPPRPEVAVEGVEPVESEVAGKRPGDRRARALVRAARHAHERDQEVEEPLRIRAPAEDVQAVPDLHLLELAEIGVELAECRPRVLAGGDPAVPVEPEAGDQFEDLVPEDREAPRVHPRRLVVLVDEALEVGERTIGLRPGEGRGQVVDDDRLRAALRLGPLARVVDDERIDVRQGAERRLREARGGEGEGLAGQPFEVPVLAHVHDRVDAGPGARRRRRSSRAGERGRGRGRWRRGRCGSPARLEPDHDVAEAKRRDRERLARFPRCREKVGVALGSPPSLADGVVHRRRQGREESEVVVKGEPLPDLAPGDPRIRRAGRDRRDEGVAARGDAFDPVPRSGHRAQEHDGSGRGVEPDPVAEPPVAVRGSSRTRSRPGARRPGSGRGRSTRARDRR